MFWSGPYLTNLLGNLGAEVIKVESIQVPDGWRGAAISGHFDSKERGWERSPLWNQVNTDKLDITLDLSRPKGAEVFKRLVEIGDIVVENYTSRVMKNFGLDYPVLRGINPRIIMIALPAHGGTGPWEDFTGYGYSIEQTAGIPQLTGYPDGLPKTMAWGFTDPIAGVNGASAVMFALLHRQMTGKGQYIDLSQVEALTSMIGDAMVDWSMNRRIPSRRGNRHPFMAPHGYYRCKGPDTWVGIAVSNDKEWEAFCETIGDPPWTEADEFADCLSRIENQDELDRLVEEWTVQHDPYEVMHTLQNAGVPAGAVLHASELLVDPHLTERGTYQIVDRAVVGSHPYLLPSAPERFSKCPARIRRPAPLLGQDNDYVLKRLLGMSDKEVQDLADEHIIGTAPLGD